MVSVTDAVRETLAGDTSWRAQAALALAGQVDESGSASAASELRKVMADIADEGSTKAGDELDEFRARRAASTAG